MIQNYKTVYIKIRFLQYNLDLSVCQSIIEFTQKGYFTVDNHTPEQRRKNMQAVKNKDSKIELLLRKELWSRGLRYRKNYKKIIGKPDIVFVGKKIAIFCDSEFWHGYDWENKKDKIKSRREFWIPKIERNMQRDIEVTKALENEGWTVLRFWGNIIKKDVNSCADAVEKVFKEKPSCRSEL